MFKVSNFCLEFKNLVLFSKFVEKNSHGFQICSDFIKCYRFQKLFTTSKNVQEFRNMFVVSKFVRIFEKCSNVKILFVFTNLFIYFKKIKISRICPCVSKNVHGFQILYFRKLFEFYKICSCFPKKNRYSTSTVRVAVTTVPCLIPWFATTLLLL